MNRNGRKIHERDRVLFPTGTFAAVVDLFRQRAARFSAEVIGRRSNREFDHDVSSGKIDTNRINYFFSISKFFLFFVMASHQQIFEIFEKVEFLHDHEELDIGNGIVIFSERSSFRKANNF